MAALTSKLWNPIPAGTEGGHRAGKEPEVNKLFRMVMKHEASDLHLKVGQPPMMRLRGDIRRRWTCGR